MGVTDSNIAVNNAFFLPKFFFCVDQINAKYIFELTFVGKRA